MAWPLPAAPARGLVSRIRTELLPPYIRAYLAITALLHLPFAWVVATGAAALGAAAPWTVGIAAALGGTVLFLFASRTWRTDRPTHGIAHAFVDLPYWIHWTACQLAVVPLTIVAVLTVVLPRVWPAVSAMPQLAPVWVYLLMLAPAFYGTVVRRRWFVVRETVVELRGLPPSLDGYRIAHLSDLHVGSMTPLRWARRWAAAANAAAPDLTVVTGDLISSGNAFDAGVADVLAELSARDGVYISLGNHDYFGDAERLVAAVRARSGRVLRNEGVVIARGDGRLYLAALDDTWTGRDDLAGALAGRPEGAPIVLLAHDPLSFPEAARSQVALTLSGHTHGGQVRVPWVPWFGGDFRLGRYVRGESTLFVNPGLGTMGPPSRIGVPPTIAVYRLANG